MGCIMSRCNQCGVEIRDNTEYCPLCHSVLESGGEQENLYPDIRTGRRRMAFAFRILLFIWVAVSIVCFFTNYQMKNGFLWSVIVSAVLFYPIYLLYIIAKDKGYIHRIFFGVIGAAVIVVLLDMVTGFHRWSVNFVLPGAMIGVDVVLIILMIYNRRNWQSYMIFQILTIIIGLVPLLLIYAGVVTHPLFSEIAFISALLVFLGTLIIGGHEARQEMKRRFHV